MKKKTTARTFMHGPGNKTILKTLLPERQKEIGFRKGRRSSPKGGSGKKNTAHGPREKTTGGGE